MVPAPPAQDLGPDPDKEEEEEDHPEEDDRGHNTDREGSAMDVDNGGDQQAEAAGRWKRKRRGTAAVYQSGAFEIAMDPESNERALDASGKEYTVCIICREAG